MHTPCALVLLNQCADPHIHLVSLSLLKDFWNLPLQCSSIAEMLSDFVCLNKLLFLLLLHWMRNIAGIGIHCSSLGVLQISFPGLQACF